MIEPSDSVPRRLGMGRRPAPAPGPGAWVLGAGRPGWRKGTDRLAAVAFELGRRGVAASLGWVGGTPAGADAVWVEARDPIRWFPEVEDPWAVLAAADCILVPSREDPLPLVALEAGDHGLPVVATPTGGLSSLLADGRGFLTQGQDLRSMCDQVSRVLSSPAEAQEAGERLRSHVRRHHRSAPVAQIWWDAVNDAARA